MEHEILLSYTSGIYLICDYVMDSGRFSSLCACTSTSREWTGIYQARDWQLRKRFCIANITSEINCHFKKVFDKFLNVYYCENLCKMF